MKTSTIEVGELVSTLSAAGVHRQLSTMPGVGVFSALFVQAEIGSIDRFRSSHELGCGVARHRARCRENTLEGSPQLANSSRRRGHCIEAESIESRASGRRSASR